jgi:hypothetical protein
MEPNATKRSSMAVWAVIVVIIILVVGAWVVYANPSIQSELGLGPHVATTTPNGMASSTARRYGGTGMHGGTFATGTIETLNGNGFTLQMQDGTTKNVTLAATTTIQNFASASSTPTTVTFDQLSVGENVLVVGMPNADGSVTARTIRTGTFPAPGAGGYRGGGMRAGGGYGGAGTNNTTAPGTAPAAQ